MSVASKILRARGKKTQELNQYRRPTKYKQFKTENISTINRIIYIYQQISKVDDFKHKKNSHTNLFKLH
jgi:hypothetical protein